MSNENEQKYEVKINLGGDLQLTDLDDEQRRALLVKLQEKKISLAEDMAKRKLKLDSSSADMDVTVNTANRLEQGKNDYHISSTHETASGRTEIKISRNTNNGVLVVIVIIGIVLIIALAKVL